ncbi:MAG: hypothetical protein V7782_10230 [Psychromonas sp.]
MNSEVLMVRIFLANSLIFSSNTASSEIIENTKDGKLLYLADCLDNQSEIHFSMGGNADSLQYKYLFQIASNYHHIHFA